MAENNVSQVTSSVKSGNLICIDFLNGETPVVLSTDVARHFQRRHSHILRDIDRLRSILPKSFTAPNFGLSEYIDSTGRKLTAYLLTRDAFSLLVMGMTGKAAILWKLRYIEAFNALEAAVRENIRTDALEKSAHARQEAAARVWRFGPVKKRRLRSAVRYRKMGLGIAAIAKLLDVNNREISELLKAAEDLGFLSSDKSSRPVQGNLLEVEA